MIKKKDLTIEEYKETLLDTVEDEEVLEDEVEEPTKKKLKKNKKNKKKFSAENNFEKNKLPRNNSKIIRIINIVFITLIVIMIMIATDVICVARYNKGPFFAIRTETYKDGGTKVYYGFGYKVIKYNQIEGRKGIEIGSWRLKYDTEPFDISALDLAIEFTNQPQTSYTKYYNKFLRVTGTYISKDEKKKTLTLAYVDEDEKYNLDIVCKMAEEDQLLVGKAEQITVIGTVDNYELKAEKKNQTLYMNKCFVK